MSQLNRELLELQASQAEFGAALDVVGTRGELLEVKRRLEGHQALLSQWEEKVARQLEFISELQSPTKRNSMMAVSAASAARESMLRSSRIPSLSGPLAGQGGLGIGGDMVGGQQAVGPTTLSRNSTLAPAANAGTGSSMLQSGGFGSSFSSASFAGGLGGAYMSASAPNSPQLSDKANSSTPVGVSGAPRRSAFTPGPALTGMGDVSPGNTPR